MHISQNHPLLITQVRNHNSTPNNKDKQRKLSWAQWRIVPLTRLLALNVRNRQRDDLGHVLLGSKDLHRNLEVVAYVLDQSQAALVVGSRTAHIDLHLGALDAVLVLFESMNDALQSSDRRA